MYQFNLNTYQLAPSETCNLPELQQICEERLQLYKIMDDAYNLDHKPNSQTWENYVEKRIIENKLGTYIILLKNEGGVGQTKARKNDHIAHWMLSLCYCHTNSLRLFFMNCELNWFVMLYKKTNKTDLEEFFTQNDFHYITISQNEKNILKEKTFTCRSVKKNNFDDVVYYKTSFIYVSNLVALRKVFLYKGVAYFPQTDLIFCVMNKLWDQFHEQLIWTKKMFPTSIKEERLENFLKNLPIVYPDTFMVTDKKISPNLNNIDEIVRTHYPLCMKNVHTVLKRDHHLKYDCRMQYGVFLKWLGLSYKDAMEFWRTEFTKGMTEEWFDRKYSYLFKHQYGQVGSKIQYEEYTCDRILHNTPQPGQHHGCPFKEWDFATLMQHCQQDGFRPQDFKDLKELVRKREYKEACSLYFSVRHRVLEKYVIKSPNQYVEASYELEDSINKYLKSIFNKL